MSLEEDAIRFAKANRTKIARELTDINTYPPSEIPVSVFMAGSPGAGKTEFSKGILSLIAKEYKTVPLRVDSDDLRSRIPGYSGSNSSEVQRAVSFILERIYDFVLDNNQTAIIDGTLSRFEKAKSNIERSLHKSRTVFVFYIYQDPTIAWKFTTAREKIEGRNIPKSAFIQQFLGARETVKQIHEEFRERVRIIVVRKNFQTNDIESISKLSSHGPTMDDVIPELYTEQQLERLL